MGKNGYERAAQRSLVTITMKVQLMPEEMGMNKARGFVPGTVMPVFKPCYDPVVGRVVC